MSGFATLFVLVNAALLLSLPRKWAPLPLLLGACYMTPAQGVDVGPFSFSVIRILIDVGVLRIALRREWPPHGLNRLDWLMAAWAAWALCSSAFHKSPSDQLVFCLGFTYTNLGAYLIFRCFCQTIEEIRSSVKLIAILLIPVAIEMLFEHLTNHNLFSTLGGVPESPTLRDGKLRAQGPFPHAIIAGTVGGICAPMMAGIWRTHPLHAKLGLAACVLMVVTCMSSGPIMSLIFGAFALLLWRWRHLTRQMRIAAVVGYVLLDLVMKAPAYYLMARIDLTGSSTGWHRAALIESALKHLGEWWFAGTDYTRHWMPTGVSWSPDHTDITNYYLEMGVHGGLPLMGLLIAVLWCAFHYVGTFLRAAPQGDTARFFAWSLGASLFSTAITGLSIPFFGQSFLFFYACVAMSGSLRDAGLALEAGESPTLTEEATVREVSEAQVDATPVRS